MKHNVLAPSVGESITEVSVLKWHRQNGNAVKAGELLLEIESDKATVEIVAEASGALSVFTPPGERIKIGAVIGMIDDSVQGTASSGTPAAGAPTAVAARPTSPPAPPVAAGASMSPAVRKAVTERGLDVNQISGSGKAGRVTKGDVLTYQAPSAAPAAAPTAPAYPAYKEQPGDRRVPMSMLRSRIAERLVYAQHTAAILTTFNECDMSAVIELRNKHKDSFKAKHGIALSFMSFFARASIEALKLFPDVNASIDGKDVIYHDYLDLGIAVGTERGLVVPVVRGAGSFSFLDIEKKIAELAVKARDGKLSITDLSGGTFTISNGGVYGSLLSTPILNPPQSAILGMHKIQERPIAINGKVEVRPMMYLALSYDHRLIDGKGAVSFLIAVKDFIEHPEKLGFEG